MAKDKKKKKSSDGKKQLSTSALRAEKTAAKKKTTTTPKAVSPTSAFSKASQQTKKQTTPKTVAPITPAKSTPVQTRRTTNVENRINTQAAKNAADKKANANKRSRVREHNPISNSKASRVTQASQILDENKDSIDINVYKDLNHKVSSAAKRNAGNWDGMKMITRGKFSDKMKENLKKERENKGRKAIGDHDYDTKGEGTRGSAATTKVKNKKPQTEKHEATAYDKDKDLSRRATADKLYGKNLSEENKRLKNFNTKDTEARAAGKVAEASNKAFEDAMAKAQADPSAENVAAAQAALRKAQADVATARAAEGAAQDALTFYQHEVRFGKGNIDLTDLPKKDNGRTTAYFTGDSKFDMKFRGSGNAFIHYDEKEKKYVLIPNYVKNDGEWQQLSSKEAIANYENSHRYFGKFDTEDEAWDYADEMTKKQTQLLDNNYAQELAKLNELKNAESRAKAAFKLANQSYQTLQTSGANKEQLAKAKQNLADTKAAYEDASEAKDKYKADHKDLKASGGVITATLQQGLTKASYGIDETLAMFANALDKDDDNFFSRRAEATRKTLEAQTREGQTLAGTANWAKTAQQYASEAVAAVPDMLIAYATGGGSAAAEAAGTTTKALTRAAFEGMGAASKAETVLNTVARSSADYLRNPNFTTSFMRTAGNSYDAAIESGASEKEAFSQGILNGVLGSMIEVGETGGEGIFGGIQKVGAYKKLMAKGDYKAMNKFIKESVLGEGMEEVAQGIVERLLQTTTYGANNPVFSTSDPNAILNPVTAAQEFAGGAVVGGLLGATTAGVNAAFQPARDAKVGRANTDARMDIIKDAKKYGKDSKSYKMAEALDAKLAKAFTNTGDETTVRTMTGGEARGIEFNSENSNNVDDLSRVVSNRELGKLMRQMAKDKVLSETKSSETETEHDGSRNAVILAGAAKKIDSDGNKVAVSKKDAIALTDAIGRIIDEGESAVSQNELKEALRNKFDFNDVGFRGAINQILGEEVLTRNDMTLVQVADLIRNKAASMHQAVEEAADIVADQTELEMADEDEAQELVEDMTEQAESEAVNETLDPEAAQRAAEEQARAQRRQELEPILAPLTDGSGETRVDLSNYEVEAVPNEDGSIGEYRITQDGELVYATDDIEDVKDFLSDTELTEEAEPVSPLEELAQQTERAMADQRDEEAYAERNAQIIEQQADAKEKEGRVNEAKALRSEANEIRERSKLHDGLERLEVDGKLYTRDEFFDLYREQAWKRGKEVTREESDKFFDVLQKKNEEASAAARMSLTGDNVNYGVDIEFDKGSSLNETQIRVGNYVAAATQGKVDRVIFCSNETMRGANASYLNGELRLNADTITTQRAAEFVLGHEFLHGASEKIAHAQGTVLNSKAGDQLTEEVIKALQDTVTKLYGEKPKDKNIEALYNKYVRDFNKELAERYLLYSDFGIRPKVEKLARENGDPLLIALATQTNQTELGIRRFLGGKDSKYSEEEIKSLYDQISKWREQVRPEVEELLNPKDPPSVPQEQRRKPYSYIRQEIAADWMGELAGQQQLLSRMAKDNHGMVYKLYQSAERMRRRMAGMAVPTAKGYVNIANKEFAKTVEEITDKLVKAMDEGRKSDIKDVVDADTASFGAQIAAGERMFINADVRSRMSKQQKNAYRKALDLRDNAKNADERRRAERIINNIENEIQRDYDYQREYEQSRRNPPESGREGEIYDFTNTANSYYSQKKKWARDTHSVLGENYDWGEDVPTWNHLYMYSTPELLGEVGIVVDTPMSMPFSAAISAATNRLTSENHSEAHNLGEDAIADAPDRINNACFIANGNHSSGKATITIASSEIDHNTGGVITYVMMPSVDGVATFAGMEKMPANVLLSAYPRQNMFGELTQYDRQIDEEIELVKANDELSEEAKAKAIADLQKYKAKNLYSEQLSRKRDGFAKSAMSTMNLESSDPTSSETGYAVEAVRRGDSLYSNEEQMRAVIDKINDYRQNVLYEQWKKEALANGTRVPPKPKDIEFPSDTLLYGKVPGTGKHIHPETREGSIGVYRDYFTVRESGKSGQNPPMPRLHLSKRYDEEVQKHPFVATHRLFLPKLMEALRTGKILGPSIAVTRPTEDLGMARTDEFDKYGDYVLVLNRQAVDPASSSLNWLFGDDAWTPTISIMAKPIHIMTDEDVRKFGEDMLALANSYGAEQWDDGERMVRANKHNAILQTLDVQDVLKNNTFFEEEDPYIGRPRAWHNVIRSSPDDYVKYAMTTTDVNSRHFFLNAYLAAMGYQANADETFYDQLERAEKEARENRDMPTATEWLANYYAEHLSAVGRPNREEVIDYIARDAFPDDPVASFYAENVPVNDENDVKELFRHGVRHAMGVWTHRNFDHFQHIRVEAAKEYESIDEAREDYDKLRWDDEPYQEAKEKIIEVANEIRNMIQEDFEDGVAPPDDLYMMEPEPEDGPDIEDLMMDDSWYEGGPEEELDESWRDVWEELTEEEKPAQYFVDIVQNTDLSYESIEAFTEQRGMPLSEDTIERFEKLRSIVEAAPVRYFEAKREGYLDMKESVGLIIIPKNAPDEVRRGIENLGIPYVEAEPENEMDYARRIVEADDMRFSLPSNTHFSVDNDGRMMGFYSELQQTIAGSRQSKMKPSQWLQYARGHGQIKQEEVDYSGILDLPDESITKEDLLDYLRTNEIQLEEEVLASLPEDDAPVYFVNDDTGEMNTIEELRDWAESKQATREEVERYLTKYLYRGEPDIFDEGAFGEDEYLYHDFAEEEPPSDDPEDYTVKYDVFEQLDGEVSVVAQLLYLPEEFEGEAYVVDTFPESSHRPTHYRKREENPNAPRWRDFTVRGNTNYREILLKIPNSSYTNDSMETHWTSERPGVLAHARVDDFVNDEGDRILFIEEIQSDWHNKGRNVGYLPANEVPAQEKIKRELDEIKSRPAWHTEAAAKLGTYVGEYSGDSPIEALVAARRSAESPERFIKRVENLAGYLDKPIPRGLNPEVLTEIYNTTQDDIERILELEDELYEMRQSKQGPPVPDAPYKESYVSLVLKRLLNEAVVNGYDRIAWTPAQIQSERWQHQADRLYEYEYDKEIPQFLRKYVKKWGGEIDTTELSTTRGLAASEQTGEIWQIPSVKITPEMRESIGTKGQPRFSLLGRWTRDRGVNERLKDLSRREARLRAQQSQNLSERARQATEDELAEVRNTADALATGQQTADVIEGPGTGQLVDIPSPRTSTIDDIFSVILDAPIERGTTGEIIESLYRTAGYNPNRSVRPSSIKQSRVNDNTFRGMPFFRRIMKGMKDENERRQAAATLNDVKNAGLYDTVTEGQSMREATRRLETDYDGERKRLYTSTAEMGATDLDVAMGILAREFAEGKSEQFMETARIIQEKATTAGQFIQAFAKYTRSPEGVLVDAMNDLKRANLSPEKQAEILDAMRDLAETLHSMQEGDMDGIIEVIKRQAKMRKTPISGFTIESLKQADWQTNYDRAIAQLRMIPRDYVKATLGEKLSTYQVLSHLLNFRTFGRNAIANAVFSDIDSLLGNNMACLADWALSGMTGQRSVKGEGGFFLSRNTMRGAVRGFRQEAANVSLDIDPYGTATKYGNSKRTWHKVGSNPAGSMMSSLEKMLGYELNVMDEFSKGGIQAQVLKSLQPLIDNGTITQEMANQVAEEEMLYRTFQDETKVGKTLGLVHDVGNMLIGFGETGKKIGGFEVHAFGLGDFIQKYTTVPGALITRAYEYSPFGYLKAIANMKTLTEARKILEEESGKTLVNPKKLQAAQNDLFLAQRHAAMSLGRASTGTGIILAFALMTGLGLLNDEDEGKDTKEKNYETIRSLQGVSGTQLNWSALTRLIKTQDLKEAEWKDGDSLVDVSFLEPMNSLMSTGALIAGQRDFQDIIDIFRHPTLKGIGEEAENVGKSSMLGMWFALSDLPTMQSLSSLQTALQYFDEASDIPKPLYVAMEVMKGSATGFVPAVVRQTAQATDEYYRDAYTSKDQMQQLKDALRNSIPEVSDEFDMGRESLPTKLTPFGEDKKAEEGRRRAINAFFNPGKVSTYKTNDVYNALAEAYATTGNDSIFPKRNAPYKLDFGTMDELNDDQRRMYQTVYGNQIQSDLSELVQSSGYKNANAETRAQMVADTKSFSEKVAKMQIAEKLGVEYGDADEVQTILDAKNVGFSLADWTSMKAEVDALPSDVNAKGNTISGSKKKKVIAYIDNFRWPDGKPLTNAQKRQLYYHHGDNYKAGSSPWEED